MRAAVLGSPIAHSLSPALHNAAYATLGLRDWSYTRVELAAPALPGFVGGLDADWQGLSLTMPLKEACLDVAAAVTPLARLAGAGNTLVRTPEGWLADNTDIPGLVDALAPAWTHAWASAAVLGAGATARSALLALADLGVDRVTVHARNPARADGLVRWAATAAPGVLVTAAPLLDEVPGVAPVVVSTLPAGAADHLVLRGPRAGMLFDAVYAGWPTPLARAGTAAGMVVVGGLDLLVHQAGRQFRLFTGHEAPLPAMFAAGRAALGSGS